jgi:hypothetical protein
MHQPPISPLQCRAVPCRAVQGLAPAPATPSPRALWMGGALTHPCHRRIDSDMHRVRAAELHLAFCSVQRRHSLHHTRSLHCHTATYARDTLPCGTGRGHRAQPFCSTAQRIAEDEEERHQEGLGPRHRRSYSKTRTGTPSTGMRSGPRQPQPPALELVVHLWCGGGVRVC